MLSFLVSTITFAQKKETRNVSTFTRISYRVPGKLYLRQGSPQKVELEGDAEVLSEIETDVDGGKLVIGVKGKWWNWNWGGEKRITVYITVENIDGLSVSGSGDLIAETRINSDNLDLNVSGSGSLKADITARGDLDADVSGSGRMDVKAKCRNLSSSISGSGKVEIETEVAAMTKIGISGSGRFIARGSTREIRTSISGSGKILAADMVAEVCEVRISGSGDIEINVQKELDAHISGSGSVAYKGNPSKINSHSSGSGKVRKI